MKAYNVYYAGNKVNRYPLTKEDIQNLYGSKTIEQKTIHGTMVIPTKDCKIIEVTIV